MPPRTQRVCHGLCTVRVCRMLCQLIGSCNPMLHPITTRFPPSGSVVCMALESCFCCPCAFCGSRYGNFDMDLASSHVLLSYVPLPPPRVTCSTPCPCLLDADWCACDRMPMRTYLSVCIPGSTCVRSTSSNMTRLRSGSATARQRRHSVLTISLAFRSSMPPRTRRVKCSAYRMPVTRCLSPDACHPMHACPVHVFRPRVLRLPIRLPVLLRLRLLLRRLPRRGVVRQCRRRRRVRQIVQGGEWIGSGSVVDWVV